MMMMSLPAMPPRSHLVDDFANRAAGSLVGNGWSNMDASTNINWTVEADGTSLSGRRLLVDKTTSDAMRRLKFDIAETPDDVEVLALVKVLATDSDNSVGQINLRNNTPATGYYVDVSLDPGEVHAIVRITSATTAVALDEDSFNFDTSNWFWVRFRAIGTSLSAKRWQLGTAEPASFQLTATDANVASGAVAIGSYMASLNHQVAFFSVGLDGATAPGPQG
jgi:hypothetical protein